MSDKINKKLYPTINLGNIIHESLLPRDQQQSRLNRVGAVSATVATITLDSIRQAFKEMNTFKSGGTFPITIRESQFDPADLDQLPGELVVAFANGDTKTVNEIRKERLKIFKEIGS